MADYYPSEVARLVLGYMKTTCPQAWNTFLAESTDLLEHNRVLQSGKPGSTNIEGKSLTDILHEYRCLKDAAEQQAKNKSNSRRPIVNSSHSVVSSSQNNRFIPYSNHAVFPKKRPLRKRHLRLQENALPLNKFTRSEAAIRFAESGHLSPRTVQKNLSTPTRPYSFMVSDQQQKNCVIALNFDISVERNEESLTVDTDDPQAISSA